MKQAMEIKLVQVSLHNPLLDPTPLGGSPSLTSETLQGNDETLEVGEFMGGGQDLASVLDVNAIMEKRDMTFGGALLVGDYLQQPLKY
nr:hypothetical protein L203_03598 [Cryptococcus depauperatus CBS 7841]